MLDFSSSFELLNLTRTEFLVYSNLAEIGRGSAQMLSQRSGVKRTTVYSSLASLIQKGLVDSEKKKSTTFYFANQPENIFLDLEKEKHVLNRKVKVAEDFVKKLSPVFKTRAQNIPKMRFVEGYDAINRFLHEHNEIWLNSVQKHDNSWWGYQDDSFVDNYSDWLNLIWSLKPKNQKIQLLSNSSPTEQKLKGKIKGREIRVVSEKFKFTSTIWIVGDYLVMIACRNEPHYAFQIHDKTFCNNLRMIFQLLWETGTPKD